MRQRINKIKKKKWDNNFKNKNVEKNKNVILKDKQNSKFIFYSYNTKSLICKK